jgi:hypothetical protein
MGITLATAQVILSVVVILAVLLPTMYFSKGKSNLPTIVMLFLMMSLLVGITWLPFWILIATVAVLSFAVASLGTKAVTGG